MTSSEGEVFNVLLNNQVGALYYSDHVDEDMLNYGLECLFRESYGLKPKRSSPDEILEQISRTSIEPSHIPSWGQNATIIDTECRSSIFEEIMSRRNELSILLNNTESILYRIGNSHISKSAITNSRLSIGLPYNLINQYRNDFTRGIKLRVISDGRKAYVKILEK